MEYIAAKILWLLVAPANVMGLCLVLAVVARIAGWWRGHDMFLTLSFLLLLAFGVVPVGPSLLAMLESRYTRPASMPEDIAGVIVLGGAFDTYLSGIYGVPVFNDGVERVMDGVMLAHKYPGATLVFSGGNGRITHRDRTEAMDAAQFMKSYPDIAKRTRYEDRSRNTLENAAMTLDMVKPDAEDARQKWVLVTSAYHMPRAVEAFKKAGWPPMILWPTDYRTKGRPDFMPHKLDILGNLYQSHLALREIIGQSVARVRQTLGI
ncbi:MAG TPA: YdcF family protein [Micavibrio sp.]